MNNDSWVSIVPKIQYSDYYYEYRTLEGLFGVNSVIALGDFLVVVPKYERSHEKRFIFATRDFQKITEIQITRESLIPKLFFEHQGQFFVGTLKVTRFGRARQVFYKLCFKEISIEYITTTKFKSPVFVLDDENGVSIFSNGVIYQYNQNGFSVQKKLSKRPVAKNGGR